MVVDIRYIISEERRRFMLILKCCGSKEILRGGRRGKGTQGKDIEVLGSNSHTNGSYLSIK